MNIKVKDLSISEGSGYISFTAVIDNQKEIKCVAMNRDVLVGLNDEEEDTPNDIQDLLWKFGDDIRTMIHTNANNVLAEYEGRTI